MTAVLIIIMVLAISVGAFIIYTMNQINRVQKMTVSEMHAFTTKKKPDAAISVGVIQNGETRCAMYSLNGAELPPEGHIYEIGSVTKTFTAALLYKAISEGRASLDDKIDKYLDLPVKRYYPTLRRLLTHTSGLKSNYFEIKMLKNYFRGKNFFNGYKTAQLIERIGKVELENKDYKFSYSNSGAAVVGAVLAKIYGESYTTLINRFISSELGLRNTMVADASGRLGKYWAWSDDDAYIPAGALTSTMEDMLKYAMLQLRGVPEYLRSAQEKLADINVKSATNAKLGIYMSSAGAAWIRDAENNIIWHNGGTGSYNCYFGFDPDRQIAVTVLSNLSYGYRVPATVIGVRMLTDMQKG